MISSIVLQQWLQHGNLEFLRYEIICKRQDPYRSNRYRAPFQHRKYNWTKCKRLSKDFEHRWFTKPDTTPSFTIAYKQAVTKSSYEALLERTNLHTSKTRRCEIILARCLKWILDLVCHLFATQQSVLTVRLFSTPIYHSNLRQVLHDIPRAKLFSYLLMEKDVNSLRRISQKCVNAIWVDSIYCQIRGNVAIATFTIF